MTAALTLQHVTVERGILRKRIVQCLIWAVGNDGEFEAGGTHQRGITGVGGNDDFVPPLPQRIRHRQKRHQIADRPNGNKEVFQAARFSVFAILA